MRTSASRSLRHAFTLVELLLVIVILAVLAAIVIPKMAGRSQQAKESAAKTQISSFETALNTYEVDTGAFPRSLEALVEQPNGVENWRGPYLKNIPSDPWGAAYVYTFPAKYSRAGFDLLSMGPDGRAGGDDDLTNYDDQKKR